MYVPEGKGLKARSKRLAENAQVVNDARLRVLMNRRSAAMALVASAKKA